MSVAPASAGVEQIVRRPFATATARAGTESAVPVAQAATTTLPNPLVGSANGTGIHPVPPFGTTSSSRGSRPTDVTGSEPATAASASTSSAPRPRIWPVRTAHL